MKWTKWTVSPLFIATVKCNEDSSPGCPNTAHLSPWGGMKFVLHEIKIPEMRRNINVSIPQSKQKPCVLGMFCNSAVPFAVSLRSTERDFYRLKEIRGLSDLTCCCWSNESIVNSVHITCLKLHNQFWGKTSHLRALNPVSFPPHSLPSLYYQQLSLPLRK